MNYGLVLAELISSVEDTHLDNLVAPIFKLLDLVNLYTTRLQQLRIDVAGWVHSTNPINRLLANFPDNGSSKERPRCHPRS